MNSGLAQRKSTASANFFRADWTYRRLPAGDAMLAAGRGMSPAFFALLGLIEPQQPVSFGELGQSLAWLHADDLELWLAELCRMGLIEPGSDAPAAVQCRAEPAVVRPQFRAELQFEAPPQNPRAVLPNPQADDLDFCRMGSTEPRSEASASTAAPCRAEPALTRPQFRPELQFEVPPQGPRAALSTTQADNFGKDWKRVSLDSLYVELLAICDELQAREQQPVALAA